MKKEGPKIIQPSEIFIKNITQTDKIRQREALRKEFLQQQKEKYKNKEANHDLKDRKKKIISQLKEVFAGEE